MSYTPYVILESPNSQRDKWLELRNDRLNASEFPGISGLMPSVVTPMEVWARKCRIEPEPEMNDAMWLGLELEPVIARMVERRTGEVLQPFDAYVGIKEVPWLGCTPDYINKDRTVLHQFKTAAAGAMKYWNEGVPDSAHIQVQMEMGITGIHECEVDALIGGRDFFAYKVMFNEDVFSQLLAIGEKFWENVKNKIPPAPCAEDVYLINRLSQSLVDDCVILDDSIGPLVMAWEDAKEVEANLRTPYVEAEKRRKALELQLRQQMQGHVHARCLDRVLKQTKIEVPARSQDAYSYFRFSVKEG